MVKTEVVLIVHGWNKLVVELNKLKYFTIVRGDL